MKNQISNLLSKHTDGRQAYQPVYNEFFTDAFCSSVKNILEIGVQRGVGVRAWLAAFPTATIYGYDCHCDPMPEDLIRHPRLVIQQGYDSSVKASVDKFFDRIGDVKMDVIIDDAFHAEGSQLPTLQNFLPHLSEHGLYIIEDTGPRLYTDPFVNQIQAVCQNRAVHARPVSQHAGVIVIQSIQL